MIRKKVNEWINILSAINVLKKEFGSSVIQETINILEKLKESKLNKLTYYHIELFNAFVVNGVNDIDDIINIVNVLKDIYRFDNIICQLSLLEEKFGISHIALLTNNSNIIKVNTYFGLSGYKKVFTSKKVFPLEKVDLETNGFNEVVINSNNPFIVDEKDFKLEDSIKNSRTLYITNFIFSFDILPIKEEMDLCYVSLEREALFLMVLNTLYSFGNDINLIVSNPNIDYNNSQIFDVNKKTTIRCDGVVKDENCLELEPSKINYFTSKILVENANFVLITKFFQKNIISLDLVLLPSFYNKITKNEDIKKLLDNMNKVEGTDVSKLLLK